MNLTELTENGRSLFATHRQYCSEVFRHEYGVARSSVGLVLLYCMAELL
jgi:hypothetical protein